MSFIQRHERFPGVVEWSIGRRRLELIGIRHDAEIIRLGIHDIPTAVVQAQRVAELMHECSGFEFAPTTFHVGFSWKTAFAPDRAGESIGRRANGYDEIISGYLSATGRLRV